jgi:hypothetical protein
MMKLVASNGVESIRVGTFLFRLACLGSAGSIGQKQVGRSALSRTAGQDGKGGGGAERLRKD